MTDNMHIHFHKYKYPYHPKCIICLKEQKDLVHIERQYETYNAHVADSIHVCYDCVNKLELAIMEDK